MSNQVILTIIIPTYNRSLHLEKLLKALDAELSGLSGVCVIVGDNASTDATADVMARFQARQPAWRMLRHPENCGAEENFCRCIEQVATDYFWIIGDDDLPRAGAIPAVLKILGANQPDLIHLKSRWTPSLTSHDQVGSMGQLRPMLLDRLSFARLVHIWTTFISGNIVRTALVPMASLRRHTGTSLVQLGWIFEALKQGQRFIHITKPCILATSGASGGYPLLKVFAGHFPRIAREAFAGDQAMVAVGEALVSRASLGYLPSLVWALRRGAAGDFDKSESITEAFEPELGKSLAYRLIIRPTATAPLQFAWLLLKVSNLASLALSLLDGVHARLSRSMRTV